MHYCLSLRQNLTIHYVTCKARSKVIFVSNFPQNMQENFTTFGKFTRIVSMDVDLVSTINMEVAIKVTWHRNPYSKIWIWVLKKYLIFHFFYTLPKSHTSGISQYSNPDHENYFVESFSTLRLSIHTVYFLHSLPNYMYKTTRITIDYGHGWVFGYMKLRVN